MGEECEVFEHHVRNRNSHTSVRITNGLLLSYEPAQSESSIEESSSAETKRNRAVPPTSGTLGELPTHVTPPAVDSTECSSAVRSLREFAEMGVEHIGSVVGFIVRRADAWSIVGGFRPAEHSWGGSGDGRAGGSGC